jgi:hypothetical protein
MKFAQPCRVCLNWMQTLLDSESWKEPPSRIARHLENCQGCRNQWAAVQALLLGLRYWPVPEPATPVARIVEQILCDRRERESAWQRGILAASLLIAASVWFFLMTCPEPGPISGRLASNSAQSLEMPTGQQMASLSPLSLTDSMAQTSPPVASADEIAAGQYSVREFAYWFLPEEYRETAEAVLGRLSSGLAMSEAESGENGLFPTFPRLDQVWEPVWDAGVNSWRLFRNVIPPLLDQPNS